MTQQWAGPLSDAEPGLELLDVAWTVDLSTVGKFDAPRLTSSGALPIFAGLVTALVGTGESGKSFLALHACLDVARSGHTVLIIDGEMSAEAVRGRLLNLGATDDELARIHYADPTMPTRGGIVRTDLIIAKCTEIGAHLVVIDSAGSLLARTARSENDNLEVTKVYDRLRAIVTGSHRALLLVDHTARGGLTSTPRGATAKFNALDVQYGVTLVDGSMPGTFADWCSTVTVEKDRHALLPGRNDWAVTFHPLGGRALHIDLADTAHQTNRLAAGTAVDRALSRIRALDSPPASGNKAHQAIGGNRQAALDAYKLWKDET